MTGYLLPPFGQLNLDALNEEYRSEFQLNGKTIVIDLHFANKRMEKSSMDNIAYFIENIDDFDKQNKVHIQNDFDNEEGETVKEYVLFHVEELGDELLEQLNIDRNSTNKEQEFLTKLHLKRVGFYPGEKQDSPTFAVFDYTVGEGLVTDELIVVNTNEKGDLARLSWES